MLVYSANKEQFNLDVINNRIADAIENKLKELHITGGQEREYISWQQSMNFMRNALDDKSIPNANIAIEYQIPRTSKRVDFIISGEGENHEENVVIVELKQWEKAEKVNDVMVHSVRTYVGGGLKQVNHPSYQAYAYSVHIKNASALIQDEKIGVIPCAYLHNFQRRYRDSLSDPIYEQWYEEAPFFISDEAVKFREFIKKYIRFESRDHELLFKIDNGRIRPSTALQDAIVSVLKGKQEFLLLDDQATAYDICLQAAKDCVNDGMKRTIIIRGGPGTGKSVLAINLLKELTTRELNVAYCTKNNAPRNAYLRLLTESDLKKEVSIKALFRSPFGLAKSPISFYDCLLVDEAHRLVQKMYGDWDGKNQVKECIQASKLSVFLIDEDQRITTKDIGSIDEIRYWAKTLGSEVIMNDDLVLSSQFRCNGSDAYIQLVDNFLQVGEYVDIDVSELHYDMEVFTDPCEMREHLRLKNGNNKARMIAGYCFDWDVKNRRGEYDIVLSDGFKAKWNLVNDNVWAINPNSFEEVGCIHTAQGLEFDYVGVIIGKDLTYDKATGKVVCHPDQISKDDKTSGIRTAPIGEAIKLIKNTYKTLLTRGQKGCYVYCQDAALAEHLDYLLKKRN